MRRPSLLAATAALSAMAAVANAVSAASPGESNAPQTRLGLSIDQELGSRDRDAVRRKRALDLREQAAKATEARLKAQLDAQQQQPASPANPAGIRSEEGDQYDELASIYQAMKPAKAAVVFEQLAMDVQMKVATRMRERSTAMILASMTPKGAAALSMALARRYPQSTAPESGRAQAPR